MGVVKAMVGLGRSAPRAEAKNEISVDMVRDSTMEDGLRHMMATLDSLAELDQRISDLEGDLLGSQALNADALPAPSELGLDGFVPRLMEASLLIGAFSRRMHLRMGVIEGALGLRARPVTDAYVTTPSADADEAETAKLEEQVDAEPTDDAQSA